MNEPQSSIDRRQLLRTAGAGALGAGLLSLAATPAAAAARPARGLRQAPDGPPLKAGLVGCGGRGSGAVFDFLAAGPNLTIAALADVFEDRLVPLRDRLKTEKGIDVPPERCFLGFDAYEKLLETDVDVVLLATPPHFRPEHFRDVRAGAQARLHGEARRRRSGRCALGDGLGAQGGRRGPLGRDRDAAPPPGELPGDLRAHRWRRHRRHRLGQLLLEPGAAVVPRPPA